MSKERCPTVWTIRDVQSISDDTSTQAHLRDGTWGPARPYPLVPDTPVGEFKYRLRMALKVFRGQCDALDWMDN